MSEKETEMNTERGEPPLPPASGSPRRCRYETVKGERVWIPECTGGAVYGKFGCTCKPPSDRMIANLIGSCREADRLKALAPLDLIREVLKTDAADYPAVEVLMERFCPYWFNKIPLEGEENARGQAPAGDNTQPY